MDNTTPAPATLSSCQSCKATQDYYHACVCYTYVEGQKLVHQMENQKQEIDTLKSQLQKAENEKIDSQYSNLRREIALNIESEIKRDYFYACPSKIRSKYQGLDHHSVFEVRSWLKNRHLKKKLDRKWKLYHLKGINSYKQCMSDMKRYSPSPGNVTLDFKKIDYSLCCRILLDLNQVQPLSSFNLSMQYLNLLDKIRATRKARQFLYI